jgi:hypothetical protein
MERTLPERAGSTTLNKFRMAKKSFQIISRCQTIKRVVLGPVMRGMPKERTIETSVKNNCSEKEIEQGIFWEVLVETAMPANSSSSFANIS